MKHLFLLHPTALERLKSTGLAERADNYLTMDRLPEGSAAEMILDLQTRGYFHRPIHELSRYKRMLNRFDSAHLALSENKPEPFFMPGSEPTKTDRDAAMVTIEKYGEHARTILEWDDFAIFGGYYASLILDTEEFWHPERFGFENIYDLHGCIGTYLANSAHNSLHPFKQGHVWRSAQGKQEFIAELTHTDDHDLRLFRTDVTHYATKHPTGRPICYRPIPEADKQQVQAHHSAEPALLVALLRYASQVKSPNLQEKIRDIMQEFPSPAGSANLAVETAFARSRQRITQTTTIASSDWCTRHHQLVTECTSYRIPSAHNGIGVYIDEKRNLCFSEEPADYTHGMPLDITARFPPDDIPALIRGLFVQAQHERGRTSVDHLAQMLQYWSAAHIGKRTQKAHSRE